MNLSSPQRRLVESDQRMRELQRRAAAGDPEAEIVLRSIEDRNLDAVGWLAQVLRGGELPNTPEFQRAVEIVISDGNKAVECTKQSGLPWTILKSILGEESVKIALSNIANSPETALTYAKVIRKIDSSLPPAWGWGAGEVPEIARTALENIISNSFYVLEYYKLHILDGREWPGAQRFELGRRAVESIASNPSTAVAYAQWRGKPWVDGEIGYEIAVRSIGRSTRAKSMYSRLLQSWKNTPAHRQSRGRW